MSAMPLASFSVCTYNQKEFIRDAVRGALAQTYSPLEILIYDDCSTDGTFEIVQEEVARYNGPNKIIARRNDKNLGSRLNHLATMHESTGEFILLADGDDVSHPDRTKRTVDAFLNKGVSVVTCNGIFVDATGRNALKFWRDPNGPFDATIEELALQGSNAWTFGPGLGLSREMVSLFGLPPPGFESGDLILPFWGSLLNGCEFVAEPLVKYRVHDGNNCVGRRVERSTGKEKAVQEERQWYLHAAIALWEIDQLQAFVTAHPERAALRDRILPLLYTQVITLSQKWVGVWQALDQYGSKFVSRDGTK